MTPNLVERAQVEDIARAHGLLQWSPCEVDAVYGRWEGDALSLSVTWHERGWWAAVEGRLPNGDQSGVWRSSFRPQLALIEAQVIAAERCFSAERARAA